MTNTVLEKKGSIHPSAVIHPSAEIGEGVIIGPNVVIGEGVKLGNGTRVIANAYIEFAEIGENCTISPFSTIGSEPQDLGYKGALSLTQRALFQPFRESYLFCQNPTF